MKKIFTPDHFMESVFDITPRFLMDRGIRNIIVDIDNTLSKWGSAEPELEVCRWIESMRKNNIKVCILSNSSSKRINRYCRNMDVLSVNNVHKPLKSSFIKAMTAMEAVKYDTCVIGDQVFTDIVGGNKSGIFTILVKPIDRREFIMTRFLRKLENVILKKVAKK